ncbi:MAG: squalene synthase HpnC [Betaproteobacteria bacterium]|nr:squalene synthase HpnC [Betaproteobacteria bacterium]
MQSPASHRRPTPIAHYENFPVASWLCPSALRAPVAAIYHFARCADDMADEGDAPPEQRLRDLHDYREQLRLASDAGMPEWDPRWGTLFADLQEAIRAHRLPVAPLQALLDAFVQDVQARRDASRYASEADLLDYCGRSANPIGRLLLHLYRVSDPQLLQRSDAICTALQLINFWQDLGQDIARGRHYLPQDACRDFGVDLQDLLALRQTPAITLLLADCAERARQRMLAGAALVHRIPGRAGWELRLVVQGGLRILDKMQARRFDTLLQRPRLRWWDTPLLLWRALRM